MSDETPDPGEWRELPAITPQSDPALRDARRRLRQAVVQEITDHGYHAATVSTIVATARVSRSTFYELYEGKDDCLLDAYAAHHRAFVRAITSVSWSGGDLEVLLVQGVDAYLAAIFTNPRTYQAFQRELSFTGPAGIAARHKVFESWATLLHRRIGEALASSPRLARGRKLADVEVVYAVLFGANELMVRAIEAGDARPSFALRRNIIRLLASVVSVDADLEVAWAERHLQPDPAA